jgi:hypothetical protein
VLGDNGSGNFEWMAEAIEWGITKKARFMSFSLGSGPDASNPEQFSPGLLKSIRKAIAAGIIVIVAAGNDNGSGENGGFPARYGEVVPELIVVAACDQSKNIAQFSTRSKSVNVAAPGVDILSAIPGGKYAEWDGTSMACPKVAGVAALYIADCDNAGVRPSPAEFKKLIEATSQTKNPSPPSNTSGWGLIQADKFVGRKAIVTPPPVKPDPSGSVVIDFTDLSPTKQAELLLNGVKRFRLEVGHDGLPHKLAPAKAKTIGTYNDCVDAVDRGETVYLCVGHCEGTETGYRTRDLSGIAAGIYKCFKRGGVNTMERVDRAPAPVGLPPHCTPGWCPPSR